jgi:hypothetical protein
MKSRSFVLALSLSVFLPYIVFGGLLDVFRSATGVYTWEATKVMGKDIEEIDVRSDDTFVWKVTSRLEFPGEPAHESTFYWRGRWKIFGSKVSFYTGDDDSGDSFKDFALDDGDLIEKTGLKRRFSRRRS